MGSIGFKFSMDGSEHRRLSIKPADFLKSVGKAAIKIATGGYADALAELPDVAASLGLKASPQERVGALVLRGLERALASLVAEMAKESAEIVRDIHAASFLGLSECVAFEIDRNFFENPGAAHIVQHITPDAERWLDTIGVPKADISNLIARLPSIFVRSLHDEWRSSPGYYAEILSVVESPFVNAAIMEQEWARYRAYLISMGEERVFDESFGLRQIYVSPRCYFFDKQDRTNQGQRFTTGLHRQAEPLKVLCWAQEEIMSWIAVKDKDFSVRTIAGGPGSGKSSFAKILAADLALKSKRVLFVPLHLVDLELGISRTLSDYFSQAGHFSKDPLLEEADEPLVLILDGLDEIQMQGKAAQDSAQGFVNDLIRYVDRKNTVSCRLQCILTGRDLAIQSAEGVLKIEGQVVHIAPYKILDAPKGSFIDNDEIFELDQRDEWWSKYGSLTGLSYNRRRLSP